MMANNEIEYQSLADLIRSRQMSLSQIRNRLLGDREFALWYKNKYDDNSSEKTNVHISYSSDSLSNENYKTIKYISGNYHPSEEIKQIVKVNNNNIYNNHSLRDVYHRFEIFKDTPYNIKYLCCNGNGMRYTRKL